MVSEVNMDKQDMIVEFLHPHGPQKYFKCPINPDRCLVPVQSVLYTILVPVTTNWCMYEISDSEFDNIVKSYEAFLNTMQSVIIRNVKFRNIYCRVKQEFSIDMMKHMFTFNFIY